MKIKKLCALRYFGNGLTLNLCHVPRFDNSCNFRHSPKIAELAGSPRASPGSLFFIGGWARRTPVFPRWDRF